MNPLRVSASNYGPYPALAWEIPSGLSAIVGVNGVGDGANSNGSGKTKLLELVPICLFGPALPWGEYLTVGVTETLRVELEFEHGNDLYKVRRTYDPRGKGKTTLDFEREGPGWHIEDDGHGNPEQVQSPPEWEPLTRDSQIETQKAINQTIGLSEATFAHSVFAGQGARHFADPTLPPRERKAIMAEALGLEVWDKLLEVVRADVRDVEASLAGIVATLGSLEDDLAQREDLEAAHAMKVTDSELNAAALTSAEAAFETAATAMRNSTAQRTAFLEAAEKMDGLRKRLTELEDLARAGERARGDAAEVEAKIAPLAVVAARVDELGDELNRLTVADQMRGARLRENTLKGDQAASSELAATNLNREAAEHRQRAAELRQTLEQVRSGQTTICEHCKQPITNEEARGAAAAGIEADIATLERRAVTLTEEATAAGAKANELRVEQASIEIPPELEAEVLAGLQQRLGEARTAGVTVAGLREQLARFNALAESVEAPEFAEKMEAARAAVVEGEELALVLVCPTAEEHSALASASEQAAVNLTRARLFDTEAKSTLAVSTDRLKRLAELAERAQESIAARAGLQGRLTHLKALERAYGRDGIPALILEAAAIPQVEAEAQRVLEQLGMPFRIELVTQRENKGGGLKDTLDVVVHEPNGPRRYETYSGGERTRLELALRIALARLIAQRRAARVGMLALDEPSWLDASGMTQLAEVLRGLTEFRAIVLVSHDERLVDAFDQTVSVIRDESGSRLEEAS